MYAKAAVGRLPLPCAMSVLIVSTKCFVKLQEIYCYKNGILRGPSIGVAVDRPILGSLDKEVDTRRRSFLLGQ